MAKTKSKQEEALEFLDNLDNFSTDATVTTTATATAPDTTSAVPAKPGEAADVLAFIDEITQKSSEPTRTHIERPLSRASTPAPLRKSTERVKVGARGSSPAGSSASLKLQTAGQSESELETAPIPSQPSNSGSGWGWGSVWSSASSALQQARSVVDEQVKHLPNQEHAMKWRDGMMEYAKNAQLDKLGQDFRRVGLSTLTDLLNVVAPPISEHEVIKVWLSYDMLGYDGVESLVYKSLARIMEQIEGGDLVVNKGNESKPKDTIDPSVRDMQAVEGLESAIKLAQANIDELMKNNKAPESKQVPSVQNPTTTSYVYLRIQPFMSSHTISASTTIPSSTSFTSLKFLLYLVDPENHLTFTTVSQSVPEKWLEVWDQYDWVEDLVAEALRVSVEVVGQEYIVARMGWTKDNRSDGDSHQETTDTASTST